MNREDQDYRPHGQLKRTRRTPCKTRHQSDRLEYPGYDSDSGISTTAVAESPPRIRMAKQDKTKLEEMMEMFMKIRDQDKKDDNERRELEKREYEERRSRERREERERMEREQERRDKEEKDKRLREQERRDTEDRVPVEVEPESQSEETKAEDMQEVVEESDAGQTE